MKITTRTQYGLEVTIESENTKITEDLSRGIFSKDEKNFLGFPLKIGEKVDDSFRQDVLNLVEDICCVEAKGLEEVLMYFWDRADGSEKDAFLEHINSK